MSKGTGAKGCPTKKKGQEGRRRKGPGRGFVFSGGGSALLGNPAGDARGKKDRMITRIETRTPRIRKRAPFATAFGSRLPSPNAVGLFKNHAGAERGPFFGARRGGKERQERGRAGAPPPTSSFVSPRWNLGASGWRCGPCHVVFAFSCLLKPPANLEANPLEMKWLKGMHFFLRCKG